MIKSTKEIQAELQRVKKVINKHDWRTEGFKQYSFYGAQQALEWVLGQAVMAPSKLP